MQCLLTHWQRADIYLAKPLLLFQSFFGKLLPFCFHGQTHNVLFANRYELLSLEQRRVELYSEEKSCVYVIGVSYTSCNCNMWPQGIQGFPANLCNFLFVVDYEKRHGQQDGSEAFDCFLKSPGGGQLVTLLQTGDEVREAQANSWESVLRLVFLKEDGLRLKCIIIIIIIIIICILLLNTSVITNGE